MASIAVDLRAPSVCMAAIHYTLAIFFVWLTRVCIQIPLMILTFGMQKVSAVYSILGMTNAKKSCHASWGSMSVVVFVSHLNWPTHFSPFYNAYAACFLNLSLRSSINSRNL